MNLKKYEAFVRTVELGSLTKAAQALGSTQSRISHILNDLEEEYGFRLKTGGRYPGRYYMKTTSISYEADHAQTVIEGTNQILEAL